MSVTEKCLIPYRRISFLSFFFIWVCWCPIGIPWMVFLPDRKWKEFDVLDECSQPVDTSHSPVSKRSRGGCTTLQPVKDGLLILKKVPLHLADILESKSRLNKSYSEHLMHLLFRVRPVDSEHTKLFSSRIIIYSLLNCLNYFWKSYLKPIWKIR
jgi:hypothetical protein